MGTISTATLTASTESELPKVYEIVDYALREAYKFTNKFINEEQISKFSQIVRSIPESYITVQTFNQFSELYKMISYKILPLLQPNERALIESHGTIIMAFFKDVFEELC